MQDQGKAAEAEPFFGKALKIFRKVLGEEHPDTATSYNNVAHFLHAQGKAAEAEPLYRKALAIRRKALGEEHPDTLTSYNNVAYTLHAQGKTTEAAEFLVRAMAAFESSRLAIAVTGLDRSDFGVRQSPYLLLAAIHAQMQRPVDAWLALENNLARGLLDQWAASATSRLTPAQAQRRNELAAKLKALEPCMLRLAAAQKRSEAEESEFNGLHAERSKFSAGLTELAAELSKREVATRQEIQGALAADTAWLSWVDVTGHSGKVQEHWACVLRSIGEPIWARLSGSGSTGEWTTDDAAAAERLRNALRQGSSSPAEAAGLAKKLHEQCVAPLEKNLRGIRHLYVSAVDRMAGVPVELLTDKYIISYVPSGTFLARLKDRPAPVGTRILALGDPIFTAKPEKGKPTELPPGGLLALQVLPRGMGAKYGLLQDGDVLLNYAGTEVKSVDQLLKLIESNAAAKSVEIKIWRAGEKTKINTRDVPPGKFGIVFDKRPAPEAIAQRRKTEELLLASSGSDLKELPGTRVETAALKRLFGDKALVLDR